MSSRKNNNKKQYLKLKKQKSIIEKGRAQLTKKIEAYGATPVIDPEGAVKMSEVIKEFAEPLLKDCNSDEEIKNATRFAILVWNASLLPLNDRGVVTEKLITQLTNSDHPDNKNTVKFFIDMLMKRKEKMFPDIKRAILDCQFSGAGFNLRFDVASSL